MKNAIIILVLGLAIGAVSYWGFTIYGQIGDVKISGNGMAAMAIGLILTLVVGVGLMALLFFSNRHGHDEEVHYLTKGDDDHTA